MISNYILETKILQNQKKREVLVKEKSELQKALSALGIGPNQVRSRSHQIDERTFLFRDNIVQKLKDIDKQFSDLNDERRQLSREHEAERNKVLKIIFKEIFNKEQLEEIGEECDRRIKGESASPLSFNFDNYKRFKEEFYKYRELAKDHINKTIELRILLTKVIEDGCEKFGDAEFMKVISPLNRLIIPLKELHKIKAAHLL